MWQIGVVLFEMLQGEFETNRFLRNELTISDKLSKGKKNISTLVHTRQQTQICSF